MDENECKCFGCRNLESIKAAERGGYLSKVWLVNQKRKEDTSSVNRDAIRQARKATDFDQRIEEEDEKLL